METHLDEEELTSVTILLIGIQKFNVVEWHNTNNLKELYLNSVHLVPPPSSYHCQNELFEYHNQS
jgi:hypothetical protein